MIDPKHRGKLAASVAALVAAAALWFGKGSTPNHNPPPPPAADTTIVGYRTVVADSAVYKTTAELRARISANVGGTGTGNVIYTDGPNAGLAVVDTVVKYNGHNTIGYLQPAGKNGIPEMWVGIQPLKHVWVRLKIRYSPGWTTRGTLTNSSNAYKMFGWGFAGYDGSGRIEITNTTQYQFYFGVIDRSNAVIVPQIFTFPGNITDEWTKGEWNDYVIDLDHSRADTVVDRLWMAKDGQTPVLKATLKSAVAAGKAMPLVNAINLGMNFNQQRDGLPAQQLNYGQWEVVDGSLYSNPFKVQ